MLFLIADSGPLIALAKLGLLDLPALHFGRAAMPATVLAEGQLGAAVLIDERWRREAV